MTGVSKRYINTDANDSENGLTGADIAAGQGSTTSIADALAAVTSSGNMASILVTADSRGTGEASGTAVAGENKRNMAAATYNSIINAYVASGSVYLPAGTYLINASAAVSRSGVSRAIVRGNGLPVIVGHAVSVDVTYGAGTVDCSGAVTLDVGTTIELFSYHESGLADTGMGVPVNVSGCPEVYASMTIVKL